MMPMQKIEKRSNGSTWGEQARRPLPVIALGVCAAVGLALGGCSSDGDSSRAEADVVQVTGTSTNTGGITWVNEFSDPRVNGHTTNDPQCEYTDDGDRTTGICTATSMTTNDGGTWEGVCTGTTTWTVSEPEHMHDIDCTWVGAGGYEGLRFVFNIKGGDGPWEITTGQIEPFTASPAAS
jgi:hypothetical protein